MKTITIAVIFFFFSSAYPQWDLIDKVKEKAEEEIDKSAEEKDSEEVKEETEVKEERSEIKKEGEELKSYSKFDFIPGEQVLFFEDFSQDNVGDFPALWNTNSSGEVVTFNNYPGHWFQYGNDGVFVPEIKGVFGENFTMEFDLIYTPTAESNLPEFQIDFISAFREDESIDAYVPGSGGCAFKIGAYANSVFDWKEQNYGDINNSKDNNLLLDNMKKKVRVSFSFQKQRVRFWLNEEKIYDLPRLLAAGLIIDRIRFSTWQTDDQKPYLYITNLRVAVGLPDMRNKLITEGKLVTHGILFDINSDKIKPESYGTIKEIANVLKENSAVKVKIIGHTDSDGSDASNLDLSKKRAESVKSALNIEFGIDTARMETDGKGETEPVSDNNTPNGKANNRRVEFLKL
jgi:outer membrane protein OmpA-like peptidoglycan-associated protein